MKKITIFVARKVLLISIISLFLANVLLTTNQFDLLKCLQLTLGSTRPRSTSQRFVVISFRLLFQLFNSDAYLFQIRNHDYLSIRYGSKAKTRIVFLLQCVLMCITFLFIVIGSFFCCIGGNCISDFLYNGAVFSIVLKGFTSFLIYSFLQALLMTYYEENIAFGILMLFSIFAAHFIPFRL